MFGVVPEIWERRGVVYVILVRVATAAVVGVIPLRVVRAAVVVIMEWPR